MRSALAVFSLTFCITSQALAGAWLQPKGQGLFIAEKSYFSSTHYFDNNADRQKQPAFSKWETQPYVEYGLAGNITIGGTAYAQSDSQSDHEKLGIADPQIFARSTVWKSDGQLISLQPLIKFPSNFRNKTTPRGGSSSHDYELSALYGRNLRWLSPRDYLDVSLGYRIRDEHLHNQYHADAALGLGIGRHWMIVPAIRSTFATHLPQQAYTETGDLDYDLVKAEIGAIYAINDKRSLNMNVFDHVWGKQTGDGIGASIGFMQRF